MNIWKKFLQNLKTVFVYEGFTEEVLTSLKEEFEQKIKMYSVNSYTFAVRKILNFVQEVVGLSVSEQVVRLCSMIEAEVENLQKLSSHWRDYVDIVCDELVDFWIYLSPQKKLSFSTVPVSVDRNVSVAVPA